MEQEIPVRVFDDDPNVYIAVDNRGWKWYYYDPDQNALGAGAMGKVFLGYNYDTTRKLPSNNCLTDMPTNPPSGSAHAWRHPWRITIPTLFRCWAVACTRTKKGTGMSGW